MHGCNDAGNERLHKRLMTSAGAHPYPYTLRARATPVIVYDPGRQAFGAAMRILGLSTDSDTRGLSMYSGTIGDFEWVELSDDRWNIPAVVRQLFVISANREVIASMRSLEL